jgi:hypothetical protein
MSSAQVRRSSSSRGRPRAHGPEIADHRVDEGERCLALLARLRAAEKAVMGARPRLHEVLRGRGAEGVLARLRHQVRDVAELRRLGDAAPRLDAVELGIAQHRELALRPDAQPGRVEEAHQVAHRHHPGAGEPVDLVEAGEEDVLAPLQRGQRGPEAASRRRPPRPRPRIRS